MARLSASLTLIAAYLSLVSALPSNVTLNAPRKIGRRCTGEIQSLADVAAAEECTTIVVSAPMLCLSFMTHMLKSFCYRDWRIHCSRWAFVVLSSYRWPSN